MKKILAVGAFERDNFGDLLFLRTLRDYMEGKDAEVTPASIIFSDTRVLNGEIVHPYALMLDLFEWDVVWVVGGEVGGVDITSAVLMDAVDNHGQSYGALNDIEKKAYSDLLHMPDSDSSLAYLPDLRKYSRNRKTKMIVNSVGLANSVLSKSTLKNAIEILSNSTVSVRESESVKFCKENGIRHTVAPDVVSTIAHFRPLKRNPGHKEPYVTVQINSQLLGSANTDKLVDNLKEISEDLKAKIILLRAGVTFGHDDESLYEDIIKKFESSKPKYRVEQFTERDPLLISDLIAGSKLCIATSLHCRIVSESYGVPRISLTNAKVSRYVSTWEDDRYPHDVKPEELVSVVKSIRRIIDTPIESDGSISEKALANLEELYKQIRPDEKDGKREAYNGPDENVMSEYAKGQKAVLDGIYSRAIKTHNEHQVLAQNLNAQVQDLTQLVHERDKVLTNTLSSKSYRIGRLITAPYRITYRISKGLGKNE